MKIIYVNFLSRFCNNIFQYIYALMLHDKLKDKLKNKFDYKLVFSNKCIIKTGLDEKDVSLIPIFNFIKKNNNFKYIKDYYGVFSNEEKKHILSKINFNTELDRIRKVDVNKDIVLSGYFQDIKYYVGKKSYIKDKLKYLLRMKINNELNKDDVVIHVRTTDLIHRQYSYNYYTHCIDSNDFKRIFILTDNINHDYIKNLKEKYKNIIMISKEVEKKYENGLIINDFLHLYYAKNIIMSISTFSWFGAWISDAEKIYFPYDDRLYLKLHVKEDRYIYVNKKNKFLNYKEI